MRKGGGKQKGNQFEREVAVSLSRWVSDGVQDDIFWRSATSGGRATWAKSRTGNTLKNQVGDLSYIDSLGKKFIDTFAVEIKHYASLDFQGLITCKGKLCQFWATINKESTAHGKYAMLIAKQNRMPVVVCVTHSGLTALNLFEHQTILISRRLDLYILDFDYFLTVCSPVR